MAHLALTSGLRSSGLRHPESMLKRGIRRLEVLVVQMWRPHCLDRLSSAISSGRANASHMPVLVAFMAEHNMQLRKAGCAVLVVSFADLLWQPHRSVLRMQRFLPFGLRLRGDFLPVVGRDVFPGNHWKVNRTVAEYASAHPAESVGCDQTSRLCNQ